MKKTKKCFCILFAVLMLITAISFAVNAESETSSICGDDLTWSFDEETGTLTISGEGKMYNYYWQDDEYAPWYEYAKLIKSVVLEEGVSTIGSSAFYKCSEITDVLISEGVISIAENAFLSCEKLESITIPDSVMYITSNAFLNTPIYNNESNWINGALYIGKHLIKTQYTISGTYEIIDGTKSISDGAFFMNESLSEISIPNSIEYIGDSAFASCYPINSVYIPNSVKYVGGGAFRGCSRLETVNGGNGIERMFGNPFEDTPFFDNNVDDWENGIFYFNNILVSAKDFKDEVCKIKEGTIDIATGAFQHNNYIKSLVTPESLRYIENYAFSGNFYLESVKLNEGLEYIGDCFSDCFSLETITIPSTVSEIEWQYSITKVKEINVDESNLNFKSIDGVLFSADGKKLIYYPRGRENTSYIIPEGVENIGRMAFILTYLEEITLPSTLRKDIGNQAFIFNFSLKQVFCLSNDFSILHIVQPDNLEKMSLKEGKRVISYAAYEIIDQYEFDDEVFLRSVVKKYFDMDFEDEESAMEFLDEVIADSFLPTIYVYSGSVAEKDCIENNIPYKLMCEEHSYTSTITKQPTCTQKGIETFVCEACGEIYTEAISATGHTDKDKNNKCDKCGVSLDNNSDNCICHKRMSGKIYKVLYKIVRVYWKLFGINKTCECGAAHY